MRRLTLLGLVLLTALSCLAYADAGPFEAQAGVVSDSPQNGVDTFVLALLKERGIEPASLCSDEVFVRRVYLDTIGMLPTAMEVQNFLVDARPSKREALIDALLARDEFADYWAMKWCDLLRVKAEFPINLWPNAVQAYHHWIRDAIRENMPYDQFAREMLTSSGSNFRVPAVNFYRAIQGREPTAIGDAVALTFLGARASSWPESRRAGLAAFFSRLSYKKTGEWKEEIVCMNPELGGPVSAVFPDGTPVEIAPDRDPRVVFADWLIDPNNPWFARNAVNRIWAWLMGRGIIHEPDDIRADNPPVNPDLLEYLEKDLTGSKYDLRHIYRRILTSRTYQQASIPRSDAPDAEALFAHYIVRRLDAEVLIDNLDTLCGVSESYSSPIPEPFTYVPGYQRTVELADGSITSPFLELFGRPARDTGLDTERNNQPTDDQALHMLNSSHIQRKIENSTRLNALLQATRDDPEQCLRSLYINILSRYPTQEEVDAARQYLRNSGVTPKQAACDLVWALFNSKEFLYRH